MTRRDLMIAGAAAAVVLLVGAGVVAIAWPDSTTKPTAVSSVPTVPPTPVIPSITDASPSPSSTAPTDNGNGKKKDNRNPADAQPLANAAPAGQGQLPSAAAVNCPVATVTVSDAKGLAEALKNATPGASIALADGQYGGKFVAEVSGTADRPIFLCGGAGAVLDGGNVRSGYVMHLNKATHWRLVGFTVTNGQKGVVADSTVGSVIQGLTVHDVGDEAIHLRNNSTDNVVLQNTIRKTGLRRDKFGEGVYIGTAVSNWCTFSNCQPDRSDRNIVKGNKISETTSEAVDIKEGTTGGVLEGNTFDGSSLSGADSWVDVKGNNWLIKQNTGMNSPMDGFQTHQILPGWGDHNLFSGNVAAVNGPGLGLGLRPAVANQVTCDNRATGAGAGLSNIPCH